MTPLLVGAAAVAAGTWLGGWVALPLVGAVVGGWQGWCLRRGSVSASRLRGPAATSALAGVAGWAVLLLAGAARGPVGEVARLAGGVLGGLSGGAFFALALLFAGWLAAAAGGACGALVQLAATRPTFSSPERGSSSLDHP